jgi:hypothetical protein
MAGLAVLPESLTVIRGHDEQGVVPNTGFGECGVESSYQLIRPGNLTVVGSTAISGGVGLGRIIGIVRVIKVQPKEGPSPGMMRT